MNTQSRDAPRAAGPADCGYRWPAEWEPHAATWLAWPHNRDTWPGKFASIPTLFARLVRTIARFEPVHVLAGGDAVMQQAAALVGEVPQVQLHDIATDDAWTRDHGPTFLLGPEKEPPALIDWQYNAWGGKYPPFEQDNAVARQIAQRMGRRRFAAAMVLEGGAIDGNGAGTLLTTPCLLTRSRNPSFTPDLAEQQLNYYLGASNVLWLTGGELRGDDTDGHIDQLARFVGPRSVVAAWEDDPRDDNFQALQHNYHQLEAMTDQGGRPLEVIPLPMPRPIYGDNGRMPASYCNFYVLNGAVVVPQFDDPADQAAWEVLKQVFPGRQLCGLPARDLIWGRGAFHCLTQQEPACLARNI